ncbi:MAG: hypothetical protein ACHBN1_21320 [Heteroscytonema crispum UTEX LB 1556]
MKDFQSPPNHRRGMHARLDFIQNPLHPETSLSNQSWLGRSPNISIIKCD